MEQSDPFAGGVEAPETDPFATGGEEFQQDGDPFNPEGASEVTQEPVEGVPVVDAEGKEVTQPQQAQAATQVAPTETPEQQAERQAAEASQAADPTQAAAQAASPASPETPAQPASPEASPAVPAAAAPAESPTPASPSPASATDEGDRPPQVNEKGEVMKRPYRILTPDGAGKWKEVSWFEDAEGNMVEKGAPGARKQTQCLVRGTDEALRIGYKAMGSPAQGIKLVAIATSFFKVKNVAPEEEKVPRMRLKIR